MSSCSALAKRRFVAPHDVACSTLIAAITTGYDATAAAVAAHSGSSRSLRAGGGRFGSGPDRPGTALHGAMLAREPSARSLGCHPVTGWCATLKAARRKSVVKGTSG